MEPEYMNLEELLAIRKPDELMDNPPFKAKVLRVDAEVREFDGRKVPQVVIALRRLATQREDGTWVDSVSAKPFRVYMKVSKRKASKYGKFIEKLWEVAPDLMRTARSLKDIEGGVFIFEEKEETLGNIKARVIVPTKYLGKEPITEEEQAMLEAQEVAENTSPEDFDKLL